MRRVGPLLVLHLLACDTTDPVELPSDAARPLRPAAAVKAAPAPVSAGPAPSPAADEPGPGEPADAQIRRASKADIRRWVRPHLRGRELAHRVFEARVGPSIRTGDPVFIVLTRQVRTGPDRFEGFAVSGETRYDFPALHEEWAAHRIAAVMFRDVDDDPAPEVIVLAEYAEPSDDPEQAERFFSNAVLDWDPAGDRFVRLESVEGEIEAFENASALSAHLRRIGRLPPRGRATP